MRSHAMTTPAQRERTQLRTKLYTHRRIPSTGRGGGNIDESDLLQLWPKLLDTERSAAKPSLTLHAMAPRPLSEHEVAVIRAWLAKAEEQRRTHLGDALAAVQCNIERQAAANQDEVTERAGEILARLDKRGKSDSELQKEATQRKQEELRAKYFNLLRDIRRPLPEAPLQPAAQYKARLRELRPLVAEKKSEAAKRRQVAAPATIVRASRGSVYTNCVASAASWLSRRTARRPR